MRGLKRRPQLHMNGRCQSHLLQMRGLKRQKSPLNVVTIRVASFTDAWIETNPPNVLSPINNVASFTDAWIETATQGKDVRV